MTLEELRVLRVVQGILVRNYVDTQKLDVEVIGSSVYIEGDFVMFDYQPGRKRTIISNKNWASSEPCSTSSNKSAAWARSPTWRSS